jgi:hypothetical protein
MKTSNKDTDSKPDPIDIPSNIHFVKKKVIFNEAVENMNMNLFIYILSVLSSFKRRRQKISMGAHRFPLYI